MENIKVKGIVLKKKNINEADLYVTIFTENYNKISAMSYGIRKSKKKEILSLNPLSISEILLTKKGDFYTIVESTLVKQYTNIKKNIEKLEITLYILDCVNKVFDTYKTENIFYLKLLKILDFIDSIEKLNRGYKYYIVLTFLRRILIEEGMYDFYELKENIGIKNYEVFRKIASINNILEYDNYLYELKELIKIFEKYVNDNLQVKFDINKFVVEDF